jgi:hypothetical protein
MMEAASTSETSVNFYQTTRHYNPEDSHLRVFSYFYNSQTVPDPVTFPYKTSKKSTKNRAVCVNYNIVGCCTVVSFFLLSPHLREVGGGDRCTSGSL